ncbi:MAG: hypothetical protein ABI761_15770 [Saprospiraceae bacterium]
MNQTTHLIYTRSMSVIVIITFIGLTYLGFSYYRLPIEQRFFHPQHNILKPSGIIGHGMGIVGTLLMIIGVFGYMIRKRKRSLSRVGVLKYWLEFHIFLCTLGPILVLFHTAFKFGGIVAISFWSMVAVVISGVIGRFIYNQIPRSIQGRELSLSEVRSIQQDVTRELDSVGEELSNEILQKIKGNSTDEIKGNSISDILRDYFRDQATYSSIKQSLGVKTIDSVDARHILKLVKYELQLQRKIKRLQQMQKLFRSWHVVHLPFALIMLVIMVIHVIITLTFGYRWIF